MRQRATEAYSIRGSLAFEGRWFVVDKDMRSNVIRVAPDTYEPCALTLGHVPRAPDRLRTVIPCALGRIHPCLRRRSRHGGRRGSSTASTTPWTKVRVCWVSAHVTLHGLKSGSLRPTDAGLDCEAQIRYMDPPLPCTVRRSVPVRALDHCIRGP